MFDILLFIVRALITGILAIIAIIIFAACMDYISNASQARRCNGVKMKFKDFEKLYVIAPDRYRLDPDCVMYFGLDKKMYIYFSIFDHLVHYRLFRFRRNKLKNDHENLERMQDYIDQVKKDLDKFVSTPPQK